MAQQFYSKENLRFLLFEVFNMADLTQYEYYSDHDQETFELVLDSVDQLAHSRFKPILTEMDRNAPVWEAGKVKVHPEIGPIMREIGEGGWIAAHFPEEEGGQQLPLMLFQSMTFILAAANYSASVYPFLSTGAANLIRAFASQELQDQFIPQLFDGKWQGTMALTEPDAGSSLGDIVTIATPHADGNYRIKGQKIFISCGDHDGVENVVHLMLARIAGAPKGVRGISLFVVPKLRQVENGRLESNDVTTAGIYHKMGYKGAPIAHLMMGEQEDCQGYLVGEPHKGLSYMFQMMNEARLGVGLTAVSIASSAYYASLEYARERPQGRIISDKDIQKPQIPIIEHADVRRMLLFQKSVVEGSLSLLLQCSLYADMAEVATGVEKERAQILLNLLTPIAKSYPSEMGCLATSAAVQCLGGAGYCEDFPVEQFYREARIHPIHEGTTGIHGLDLLGRKIPMDQGKALELFLEEVGKTISEAGAYPELAGFSDRLTGSLTRLRGITVYLMGVAKQEKADYFLADATLYLEVFGIVAIAWQWLKQGVRAQECLLEKASDKDSTFYESKIHTLRYFYEYELRKTDPLIDRLKSPDWLTVDMDSSLLV